METTKTQMDKIEVAVYLPDEDAKKFLLFQQHYDLFSLLLERGVFDQTKSSIILDFDHHGTLQSIRRNDFLYARQFENT
jgi:hypothetical protein